MTLAIPDNFDWNPGLLGPPNGSYDTPWGYSPATLATILADTHVDLRIFSNSATTRSRTQQDLNAFTQATLDSNTQPAGGGGLAPYGQLWMEQVVTTAGERWTFSPSVFPNPTPGWVNTTVGPLAVYGNWSGVQATATGAAFSGELVSSMKLSEGGEVDISAMTSLSVVFPDYHNFDPVQSYAWLCSNGTGDFSGATSLKVPFSADTSAIATEIRLPLASFANPGFALSQVTGVRFRLVTLNNPSVGQKITIMGLRAVSSTWATKTLDLNTKRGAMVNAVTLDGLSAPAADAFIPLVRGDGMGSDPAPIDATTSMRFNTGLRTIAGGSVFNRIDLLFRETRSGTTGRFLVARLQFNKTTSKASSSLTTTSGTYPTSTITENVAGSVIAYTGLPVLTPSTDYIFESILQNQSIRMRIWLSNSSGQFLSKVWDSGDTNSGSNTNYAKQGGRVGWYANLVDQDMTLDDFRASATAYSVMRTKRFASVTPVNGAQLAAAASEDINLFDDFQGYDVRVDRERTVTTAESERPTSSEFAWATSYPIFSNDFFLDDWSQTYLEYDIWVPSLATGQNSPFPILRTGSAPNQPDLIPPRPQYPPNQWSHVKLDFDQFEGNLTGIFYTLWMELSNQPTVVNDSNGNPVSVPYAFAPTPYTFYLANVKLGRRTIRWEMRAQEQGTWREFRDAINDPSKALHLGRLERGTALQLQASALTQEAWIASFQLKPRYAQLGRPTYYAPTMP